MIQPSETLVTADEQMDRRIGRQTDRQKDKQTDSQTDRRCPTNIKRPII